jgi:hypothetical protein
MLPINAVLGKFYWISFPEEQGEPRPFAVAIPRFPFSPRQSFGTLMASITILPEKS